MPWCRSSAKKDGREGADRSIEGPAVDVGGAGDGREERGCRGVVDATTSSFSSAWAAEVQRSMRLSRSFPSRLLGLIIRGLILVHRCTTLRDPAAARALARVLRCLLEPNQPIHIASPPLSCPNESRVDAPPVFHPLNYLTSKPHRSHRPTNRRDVGSLVHHAAAPR